MVQSARYAPCRLRTGLPRTSRSWSGYSGPPTISSYCARRAIPGSRSSASPHLALNAGVPKTLVSWTCRNLWSLLFAPSGDGVRRTYCYSVVSCTIFFITLTYAVPLLLSIQLFSFALMNLKS